MPRERSIREEAPPANDTVLVRGLFERYPDGRIFDSEALIADATRNFELFGYYGLSLWATSGQWSLDRVQAEKSRKAQRVALFTADALRDKGLGLVPSGREPHYDAMIGTLNGQTFGSVQISAVSAADLASRLTSATYTVMDNHHYRDGLP